MTLRLAPAESSITEDADLERYDPIL